MDSNESREENRGLEGSPLYERAHGGGGTSYAWLLALIIVLLLALAWSSYFSGRYVRIIVSGSSMESTLYDGDTLYVDTSEEAERGDIVVLDVTDRSGQFSGDYIIKRLIATEGDSLYCVSGQIYIRYAGESDYVALEEDYLDADVYGNVSYGFGTYTMGEGEVFVLGDNRTVSKDSHIVGAFDESEILGPVPGWSYAIRGVTTFLSGLGL